MEMPDWLKQLVAAAGGGGAVVAIYLATLKFFNTRANQRRIARTDEIGVLQQAIKELRSDRDTLKDEIEFLRRNKDEKIDRISESLNELRSEHTACILEQQRLRDEIEKLKKQYNGKNSSR